MEIKFSTDILSANTSRREMKGLIVPFGEAGHTNMGDVVFTKGSITIPEKIKLFVEHDMTRPIGRLVSSEETETGILGTFKIGRTNAGDDALAEAQEGLRDGFSIGASIDDYKIENEQVLVSAATLREVSHVTNPAFKAAQITEIAASESEQPNESEEVVLDPQTPEIAEEVAPAAAEAKVEAAERRMPVIHTTPRLEFSKAKYLENSVRATVFGDEEARNYVRAADDTTTNNAGLIPTPQLAEIINPLSNADRGAIDAISRAALPDAGMSFEIPKITAVPTVAEEGEGDTVTETGLENSFVSVPVKKFAGAQTFSVELLDRSAPAFFDELVRQMEFAYAKETDKFVANTLISSGQLAPTDQANDAEGLLAYVAQAAAEVFSDSLGFARSLIVSPEQWANIMGYNDAGRPIYNASNPQNAGGQVSPTSLRGNVAGLDLYVSRSLSALTYTTGDGSMAVVNPESYTWYESPRLQLRTNVIASGQVEVLYYGYGACAVKVANGSCHFNFTNA
jgi:HK97 family phage prohead protease